MVKLINLGNTCAINSLIQSILNCDINIIDLKKPNKNSFTYEFFEFLLFLKNNNNETIKPYKFINMLFNTFKNFNKGEQIDAQELWTYISNKIFEETSYNIDFNDNIINNLHKQAYIQINLHNNNKNSEWNKYFQGVLIYINICNDCKTRTFNFEPFYSININCGKTIIDMLIDYFKTKEKEKIIFKCNKCNINKEHDRFIKFYSLSKYLVISINRYNNYGQKINSGIKINKSINLSSNILINNKKNIILDLKSSICHYGNLNSGHYNNININDNIINDDETNININNINELLENNQDSYILFYSIKFK